MKVFAVICLAAAISVNGMADPVVVYNDIPGRNGIAGDPAHDNAGAVPITSTPPATLYNSFTSTIDGTLTGLSLGLNNLGTFSSGFTISLYSGTGDPSTFTDIATLATVSDTDVAGGGASIYDCTTPGCTSSETLSAGVEYWIGLTNVDPNDPTAVSWLRANMSDVGQVGVSGEFNIDSTGTMSNADRAPFMMEVTVSPLPEPSTVVPFVLGIGVLGIFALRSKQRWPSSRLAVLRKK